MKHLRHALSSGAVSRPSILHAVTLSEGYRSRLLGVATGETPQYSVIDKEIAQAILVCGYGALADAEAMVLEVLGANLGPVEHDEEVFFCIFHALCIIQRLDLATVMLKDKYNFTRDIELAFEAGTIGEDCIRWEISRDLYRYKFVFDADILRNDNARTRLLQFKWAFPLMAHYASQPGQEFGAVYVNQADLGSRPGLAYSDSRPEYFLIPDYIFVPTKGYAYAREIFGQRSVPWSDRAPVAFWRGGTTGVPAMGDDWRSLDRIKLCQTTSRHGDSGLFDVGFSSIAQIPDPDVIQWIKDSGMVLGPIPWQDWNRYKFLIDIDGNSSPWSNLFQKFLTGSPVLKIESRRGLVQWFYDDLIPWENYIPIAPDCSDLLDKVQWLIKNDDVARRIGQNGFDFAQKLTYEGELNRSIPVISAAFRYFRGDCQGAGPYGRVVGRERIYNNKQTRETINIRHTGGLGDILMATPALRALKAAHPEKTVKFYGNYRDLLKGLPYIDELDDDANAPANAIRLGYGGGAHLIQHIAQVFGNILNVVVEDVRPDCVTDSILVKKYRELFAHLPHPWVVINRRASSWTPNKEWPSSKWVELIPRLKALGGVIEIGNPASDATANDELAHIDLVGKTTLTELAAVIAACDILVTPVSGPMHIAAATHTPAVVIYGGYEQASATAYQGNDNLVSIPSCSPCWLRGPCPIDKKCLQDISVDAVEQAILKVRDKMRRFSEREDAPPPVISAAGGNVDSRSFRRSADTTANMTTLHTRIDRRSASPERAACQKATEALMGTNTLTSNLKRRLWDWHGTEAHPAEWDGNVFGGGKISQRFWEYFVALEMLDLTPDSVVMDIGGGSPATGLSIFPRILAAAGVRVIVVDKDFGELKSDSVENASLEVGTADFETLVALLQKHQPTHLSCISVLEHAAYSQQRGIFDAIEKVFHGERAVFTLEFHETDCHWEQQLTTQTLSEAVSGLRRYYLDRIERSPMHCVNALTEGQRRWYPIALKFDPVRQFSYGR